MKYQRLVAFGCSLTYGHGLKDCYSGKTMRAPGSNPSQYAWPSILAEILGIECVNLATPGASNKRIAYTIYSTELANTDLVFVNWSYLHRYCVITKDEIIDLDIKGKGKINKAYRHLADANDLMLDSVMRLDYITLLLNKNKIMNFHTLSNKREFSNYANEKILHTSIKEVRKMFPLAVDKSHPGEQAHAHFAQEIYKEIKDKL
jgi:hypothetical protein